MSATARVLALALLVLVPISAHGFGFRRGQASYSSYYPYYYYSYYSYYPYYPPAVPVYVAPEPSCPVPMATIVPVPQATPLAAPPSTTPVAPPPAMQRTSAPPVTESSTRIAAYPPSQDAVQASFWNRSSRDVAVEVEGYSRVLAPGRGMVVEVPRQFRWREGNGALQPVQVADGQWTAEVVISK